MTKSEATTDRRPFDWTLAFLVAGVCLLAIAGAVLSAILQTHHRDPSYTSSFIQAICGSGSGCDVVNRSAAARWLGIPLAAWGFAFYGSVFVLGALALVRTRPTTLLLVVWLSLAGVGVDVALLAYSLFGLHTLCNLCALTYVVTVGVAALAALGARRASPAWLAAFVRPFRADWDRTLTAALAFGIAGVVALGAYLSSLARPTPERCAEYFQSPDEALSLAWATFYKSYRDMPAVRLDVEEAPKKGATRPVLAMTLYADFLCKHCRSASRLLASFVERHRESVQLVFKNYPLDDACNDGVDGTIHPGACLLSKAGIAAQHLGRFWVFHDDLFASQETWQGNVKLEDVVALAAKRGMDPRQFEALVASTEVEGLVNRDIAEANRLEVAGAPSLLINGRLMTSIPIAEFLEELLLQESRGAGATARFAAPPTGLAQAASH